MNFADRLTKKISETGSALVAGFDPILETLPPFLIKEASRHSTTEEAVFGVLTEFYKISIETLRTKVAAVKPNIAFFEQYGVGGIRAFSWVCSALRDNGILNVIDAKRGDIGSTAQAYSRAFLGRVPLFGKKEAFFDGDALTVNPYLGFDTIEPFLEDCKEYGKGLYVLVRTSNPGSAQVQGVRLTSGQLLHEHVASWIAKRGEDFIGSYGFSSLGAVVGATHPHEAVELRTLMPRALFLIPGMGAQGGTAEDAVKGFAKLGNDKPGGALINLSRGLMSTFANTPQNREELSAALTENASRYNKEVDTALAS